MIIVPFLVIFLLTGWGGEANRYISLTLFVVASVTDWFDGYLARKNNLVTNFGKFMDPLADKLLVCSAMICMIDLKRLSAWFVIIIIAREFIISGFRLIAAENGIQGTVTLRFVVSPTGEITKVEVLRQLDPACDKEALRVIKSLPQWVPGKQNGKPVPVYFTVPVRFKLQ